MLAVFQRIYRTLTARPLWRVSVQALVSFGLIALLVRAAQSSNLAESLSQLQPSAVGLAAGLGLLQIALASCRWQILLRQAGIAEPLGRLGELYLIGQFFSLFLPTSTGGDAVRVYEVARRSGQPAATLVATLQERLLGLGSALLIGVAATLYYLPLLPEPLRPWAVLVQLLGAAGMIVFLYPAALIRMVGRLGRIGGDRAPGGRLAEVPSIARIIHLARPVGELPPLPAARLVLLLTIALCGTLVGVAMYSRVGAALGISAGFSAFCLVVPLVWIVRMAPISLNGIGVGEGAFVFLMGLFEVPKGPALALALAMLGLQTSLALLGGLLLVLRTARNSWRPAEERRPSIRTDPAHNDRGAAPHRHAA